MAVFTDFYCMSLYLSQFSGILDMHHSVGKHDIIIGGEQLPIEGECEIERHNGNDSSVKTNAKVKLTIC